MKRPKRDPVREDRIYNEAIVDARPEEQAMSWYYYLEGKITFPFRARCVAANAVSPLRVMRHILSPRTSHVVSRSSPRIGEPLPEERGIGYLLV
jgi:hypothetical protein